MLYCIISLVIIQLIGYLDEFYYRLNRLTEEAPRKEGQL